MRRTGAVLCMVVLGLLLAVPVMAQQPGNIPAPVQQELDQRGMTVEQARRQLQQLGIDPSNPQQAAQQARQLGIPQARIDALLQRVQGRQIGQGTQAQQVRRGVDTGLTQTMAPENPPYPIVAGRPVISPGSLSVGQLPRDIQVQVPLRSQNPMRTVELGFMTADGDSVMVRNLSRIRGSVVDGTWRGFYRIPRGTRTGTWNLYARAETADTTVTLATGRQLTIFPKGELPGRRDTLRYFGYDTFESYPQAFVPQTTGMVDGSYVVGPEDELRLTVWGGAEFTYDLQVDRGGRVTVPNVGQFTVAGKRLSELRQEMKQWLSRSYSGLTSDPPSVFMDLTLTRVRPARIFVIGEVAQPGGYTVSSYSTVFNALYSVGGPLKRGSLRDIKVIRDGDVASTVDIYDYLMEGYSPTSAQLQGNDYVFIPPRGKTVSITGAVKRPAYYEMKEGETVQDLLNFAGGLEAKAYAKRFQIERIVPFDEREDPSVAREVIDVSLQAVRSDSVQISLADGDRVRILSIAEARQPEVRARIDAVSVSGAVYQPGRYELGNQLRTVKDLIEEADGLTGGAYREQASLVRINDSLEQTSRSLNLNAVMEDRPQENVVLQPGDSLHVASAHEMRAQRFVEISGQVRSPGEYRYRKGMTVQDLLLKGGGLTDEEYMKEVFEGRADLFRVSDDGEEENVIPFHLGNALDGEGMARRPLKPEDEIRVYPATVERLEERFVRISGAVDSTGRYPYRDNMTLKDLLIQSNGFEEGASLQEVEVTRMVERRGEEGLRARTMTVSLIEDANIDAKNVNFSVRDTARVLDAAADFELQHRDQVFVRRDPAFQPQETVAVRGEVRYPGEYTLLRDNERLSNIIQRAGGVLPTGYMKGGRLMRDSAQVIVEMQEATQGDIEEDVILRPGDTVIIPTQPNTVAIRGNVANEGLIKHEPGRRVEYYLDRAGGTRQNTEAILLTQASGATFRVNTGWFRRAPEVDDGAVIRVTEEPPAEQQVDYTQIASNVTQILSSTLSVILLGTRVFN